MFDFVAITYPTLGVPMEVVELICVRDTVVADARMSWNTSISQANVTSDYISAVRGLARACKVVFVHGRRSGAENYK